MTTRSVRKKTTQPLNIEIPLSDLIHVPHSGQRTLKTPIKTPSSVVT